MPFEVHPFQESDFVDFVRIQMAAFRGGGGITALLTPDPLPSDYVQKTIAKHVKSWREEPDVQYLKVIDTDLNGQMIAGAKWRINEKARTEEQILAGTMLPTPGPDEEGRPAAQEFMWYLNRVRREYMGTQPFYFLHILATDPEHQRRGAGAMLIAWGLKKADHAQLPAFLESSPVGKHLYATMGFKPQHEEVFDLTKYGFQGTDTSTVMIWEPLQYIR